MALYHRLSMLLHIMLKQSNQNTQSSTLPPVRRTCPVILFVGQVNHAKSHVRLSGDDILYFFMPVSPYLVLWLRELHVIVQCRMRAAHWYIHIL